jgi:hypothetical protein
MCRPERSTDDRRFGPAPSYSAPPAAPSVASMPLPPHDVGGGRSSGSAHARGSSVIHPRTYAVVELASAMPQSR